MCNRSSIDSLGFFILLLIVNGSLHAQDEATDAAPPQIYKLERYDAAAQTVLLLLTREVLVPTVYKELDKEGRTVERIAYQTANMGIGEAFSTKDMRAFSLRGEPLKTSDVLSKLKGQPLLTVSSGKRVPKAFQPLFRDDVIVLELPPASPPEAPAPAKAP